MTTKTNDQSQLANDSSSMDSGPIPTVDREIGAAFVAAGIGSTVLGLAIVLTEMPAGAGLKSALTWNAGVGPLSGKTGVAVIAFVASWILLHFVFKNRPINLARAFIVAIILIGLGVLMSFPPFFLLFAG